MPQFPRILGNAQWGLIPRLDNAQARDRGIVLTGSFGSTVGTVLVGSTSVAPISWQESEIRAVVPSSVPAGSVAVRATVNGLKSNAIYVTVSGPPTDVRQAIETFNDSLVGSWRREDGESSTQFPTRITFRKLSYTEGIFESTWVTTVYGIVYDCDWPELTSDPDFGVMLMDSQLMPIITYDVEFAGDKLILENWYRRHTYIRSG